MGHLGDSRELACAFSPPASKEERPRQDTEKTRPGHLQSAKICRQKAMAGRRGEAGGGGALFLGDPDAPSAGALTGPDPARFSPFPTGQRVFLFLFPAPSDLHRYSGMRR